MERFFAILALLFVPIFAGPASAADDSTAPASPVKPIFIDHSRGENRLYFPHVASSDRWETEICVIHTAGEGVLSGRLIGCNQKGEILGQPTELTLGPGARAQRILGSDFPDPANTRYLFFESNSANAAGYAKFYIEGKYRSAIPAVSEVNTGDLYASHIASNDNWGTGIALVNTGAAEKTVAVEFDNGQSIERTIASGAYDIFMVRDLFGGQRQPDIDSAVIKNAYGIVGLQLFANDSANLLSGVLLTDDTTSKIFFPHIASDSGWGTGIVAYNTSDEQCEMEATAYDAAGKVLGGAKVSIGAKGRYFGLVSGLNLPAGAQWMKIEADKPITGFELFSRTDQLDGYTGVNIAAKKGVFPKIEKNGATGIAFVNTEDQDASVTLSCRNDRGDEVAQTVLALSPHEKRVDFPEKFFDSDIADGTYIAFESNREIAGFQLNVSSDGTMLDALPGLRSDAGTGSKQADWTFMVYISGDNNLSREAIEDINEMETVGSTDRVNILVQAEFSPSFSPGLDTYDTLRGKIAKDSDEHHISSRLESIGQLDMGQKETLSDFLAWAEQNYPAERYALVLWDHGEGWKNKGALEDATSGSFMTLPELANAVRQSGLRPDVVGFDACLMGMYEVAWEFASLADFMVFSEEVEPDSGDPYHTILNKLVSNPEMNARQLAELVAIEYKNFYQALKTAVVTKSVVAMSKMPVLHERLCELSLLFIDHMNSLRPLIQSARDESLRFGFPENHDLGDFLAKARDKIQNRDILAKIAEVSNALEETVIRNETYSPAPSSAIGNATGLAVFIPRRDQATDRELAEYGLLAINKNRPEGGATWGNFVNMLATGNSQLFPDPFSTAPGNFSIWLKWDSDADLDLLVKEPDGNFASPYLGNVSDNGFLSEDSAVSGISSEYYNAAETVDTGTYEIYVSYYKDGSEKQTAASVYFMDPENGLKEYRLEGERIMGLSNPAPILWMEDPAQIEEVEKNAYSDWWIPLSEYLPVVRFSPAGPEAGDSNATSFRFPLKSGKKRLPAIDG